MALTSKVKSLARFPADHGPGRHFSSRCQGLVLSPGQTATTWPFVRGFYRAREDRLPPAVAHRRLMCAGCGGIHRRRRFYAVDTGTVRVSYRLYSAAAFLLRFLFLGGATAATTTKSSFKVQQRNVNSSRNKTRARVSLGFLLTKAQRRKFSSRYQGTCVV